MKFATMFLAALCLVATAGTRTEVTKVIKADTTVTIKVDTVRTITYDTLKITQTYKDTSLLLKQDTSKVSGKNDKKKK